MTTVIDEPHRRVAASPAATSTRQLLEKIVKLHLPVSIAGRRYGTVEQGRVRHRDNLGHLHQLKPASSMASRLSRRHNVRVSPEEIRRVVLVLQRNQARIIGPIHQLRSPLTRMALVVGVDPLARRRTKLLTRLLGPLTEKRCDFAGSLQSKPMRMCIPSRLA
jgi:hypothetical protein